MTQLKEKYFSDPAKKLILKEGEYLFQKGEQNDRLFYLESGKIKGFAPEDQGEYFQVESGDLLGLHSFFSSSPIARVHTIALEECIIYYMERSEMSPEKIGEFMPMVVGRLIKRQEQAHQDNLKHEQTLKEMKEVERLAALGQLSAGVAHELNNAITVISRGNEHIAFEVFKHLNCTELESKIIDAGLTKGRAVSSAQARKMAKEFKKTSSFSDAKLRDYARTGMGERLIKEDLKTAQHAFVLWGLGATLHDIQLAVKQAEHVISSMRSLASTNVIRQLDCDINASIQNALFLLSNPLKNVTLNLELKDIPMVYGNSGELVQIWTNVIKNAIDAMEDLPQEESILSVKTDANQEYVIVTVEDFGPGIADEIRKKIFQPHVTTKKEGQTFGLGLGLTIVQKIIKRYTGVLFTENTPTGAKFTVKIPIGENI